jgi:hypothetical protein
MAVAARELKKNFKTVLKLDLQEISYADLQQRLTNETKSL